MTDLTPNDLSHLSDEEFMALCPQGEHAPGREPLSPAAQAVFDAANNAYWLWDQMCPSDANVIAAAALRAAADQVEPDDGVSAEVRQVLNKILTIAAELERF